jgi:hypothetical protein
MTTLLFKAEVGISVKRKWTKISNRKVLRISSMAHGKVRRVAEEKCRSGCDAEESDWQQTSGDCLKLGCKIFTRESTLALRTGAM